MSLAAGTRFGTYALGERLGAGGMGEVYRARDTALHRDVALKVVSAEFASDRDRLARFEREAQVLAALNHPHIAAIYGLVDTNGTRAIVMELVEGPTLAERIGQGPLPLDEALPIARQIAQALEAAHEQGIVHRDLKPANIKLRADGRVKVLDFGLAKPAEAGPAGSGAAGLPHSPTITSPAVMTGAGVILGSAAYMSPEQAKGKPVGRRADIWAFGCVLYEMLSGRRCFPGEDVSDTIAAVLTRTPDWSLLPAATPPSVQALLRRCLERDLTKRIPDASVVRWMLAEATAGEEAPPRPRRWWYAAAAAIGAVALAGVVAAVQRSGRTVGVPSYRFSIGLGADTRLLPVVNVGGAPRGIGSAVVLSPDGRVLVFVASSKDGGSRLYVRPLDQLTATPLVGTEGAGAPFFSPDGQSVAFFADGQLKRVPIAGGSVATVCAVQAGRGGSWGDDDMIVFTPSPQPGASLMRVAAAGGTPEPLTALGENEATHRWPQVLPGSAGTLFTASSSNTGPYDAAHLAVVGPSGGTPKVVLEGGAHGRYVPSGHLLYVKAATLYAVPFSLERLETTGPAVPVIEDLSYARDTGAAQFSVAGNGTLAYVPGADDLTAKSLDWLHKSGTFSPLRRDPAEWDWPAFSPDGGRLALEITTDSGESHVWLYDWKRDAITRLTFGGTRNSRPIWSPDGQAVVFRSDRASNRVRNVYWQRTDGSGHAVALTSAAIPREAASWHPNGRHLAVQETTLASNTDIAILQLEGDSETGWAPGRLDTFVKTEANETLPSFSPDGRWLAYQSDESGRNEIYVRRFPGPGGKWQVSTSGGTYAQWSPRQRELVYRAPDMRLMVVPYAADGADFRPERPVNWSSADVSYTTENGFALHPAGDRVVVASDRVGATTPATLTIVTNFFDELQRLAPARR